MRNPVAANLLMILILAAGALSMRGMRVESFPRIPPRFVAIDVVYPGATAAEVDEGVTRKIEQAIEGLAGVRRTFAESSEGFASVRIEKTSGYELQRLLEDARGRVDAIAGWPQGAERPIYTRDEFSVFGLIVQISGDVESVTLQRAARLVEEALLDRPEISEIELFGKRRYEVSVEIDAARLQALGLSARDVQTAIESGSLTYRAGLVESDGQRVLLRAASQARHGEDFAALPVVTRPDGTLVRLREVAEVRDGFEEELVEARFNGENSVGIIVNTDARGHLLQVRAAVDSVLAEVTPQLPGSVELTVWADTSEYIRDRLKLIRTNAVQGLAIILILLSLFLNVRLAVWVAIGIPISIAGTLAIMGESILGHSLNDITTFGLIIVLGIIVDDAIVVGESIEEVRKRVGDPVEGAIEGVHRVSTPTIFGALTTVAAFFPLLLIDNDIARVFAGFSVVVIAAVSVSLIESKFILPAHLASVAKRPTNRPNVLVRSWSAVRRGVDVGLTWMIERVYVPVLRWALAHRGRVVVGLVGLLVAAGTLVATRRVPVVFFPDVPGNTITVSVRMDPSAPEALTLLNGRRLERAADAMNADLADHHALDAVPLDKLMVVVSGREALEAYGEVTVEAMNALGPVRVMSAWRDALGSLEGATDVSFSGSFETGGGFALEVIGEDDTLLAEATRMLMTSLARVDGVEDVRSDLIGGQPEIGIELNAAGRHLGLTAADLAAQIGDGFGGAEVQRVQRGDDEVIVYLRRAEERRRSLHEVMSGRIMTPDGRWVTLESVADQTPAYGPGTIARRGGKRSATIRASLDKSVVSAPGALAAIEGQIDLVPTRWPGIEVRPAGELVEEGEIQRGMGRALVFIALLIYALLAVPLRSYVQPMVIMSVLPFGFAGAVFGHLLLDLPVSILSFFGAMAATGVVVNDSLVLATRCNHFRSEGRPLDDALIEGGRSRFRAILLTTVTTVCGLLPLVLETSEQAQYLIPAAVSLAAAEILATPVALVLVPVALALLDDLRGLVVARIPSPVRPSREALPAER